MGNLTIYNTIVQWYCMGNYVTTNIRLSEEDYLKLKEEAAKKRKSLSAIIREKVSTRKPTEKSPEEIVKRLRKHVNKNEEFLRGVDIVKTLRKMRSQAKW